MRNESFINRGQLWGDLSPRYELAQYDQGLRIEIGQKAFKILDVLTGPDVVDLEYTTDKKVLEAHVIFIEDDSIERVV